MTDLKTDGEASLANEKPIPVIGRNEPCPCGSRKKYKRCHGVGAAPKITAPKDRFEGMPPDANPLAGMDPEMLNQFTNALQRLPKGQMQRLQSIMQKAMSGKDVTAEAQEFEKGLPMDFQSMIHSFAGAAGMGMGAPAAAEEAPVVETPEMTEDKARALISQAMAEGKISKEQGEALLKVGQPGAASLPAPEAPSSSLGQFEMSDAEKAELEALTDAKAGATSESAVGKFWRNFSGKTHKEGK